MDKPLFIIGYMGCGKSTFGKALSQKTGLPFIDLDHYIEARQNATIPEIFATHGEQEFRRIERDMLREVAQSPAIISCGGGTPCHYDNMDFMNLVGDTLWLMASEDVLFTRLVRKREKRPLIAKLSDEEIRKFISDQLEVRKPFYSKAKMKWQSDSLEDRRQIDETIADYLAYISTNSQCE